MGYFRYLNPEFSSPLVTPSPGVGKSLRIDSNSDFVAFSSIYLKLWELTNSWYLGSPELAQALAISENRPTLSTTNKVSASVVNRHSSEALSNAARPKYVSPGTL